MAFLIEGTDKASAHTLPVFLPPREHGDELGQPSWCPEGVGRHAVCGARGQRGGDGDFDDAPELLPTPSSLPTINYMFSLLQVTVSEVTNVALKIFQENYLEVTSRSFPLS